MDDKDEGLRVPIIQEEVHADAVPVATGGVRVTKRVDTHNEIVEQELRKSHVDVKRVKTNRVVDGPQPMRREGNTLIVPVVSEVLRIEKQWVVTEEIHLVQREEQETVRETVPVNQESAHIERLDSEGNVVATSEGLGGVREEPAARDPITATPAQSETKTSSKRKVLRDDPSILRKKRGTGLE